MVKANTITKVAEDKKRCYLARAINEACGWVGKMTRACVIFAQLSFPTQLVIFA